MFKTWVKKTDYEIDVMDQKSYYKLFKDTDYVIANNKNIRYPSHSGQMRSLCIDIDKSLKAGIDLDGFGLDKSSAARTTNGPFALTA